MHHLVPQESLCLQFADVLHTAELLSLLSVNASVQPEVLTSGIWQSLQQVLLAGPNLCYQCDIQMLSIRQHTCKELCSEYNLLQVP